MKKNTVEHTGDDTQRLKRAFVALEKMQSKLNALEQEKTERQALSKLLEGYGEYCLLAYAGSAYENKGNIFWSPKLQLWALWTQNFLFYNPSFFWNPVSSTYWRAYGD